MRGIVVVEEVPNTRESPIIVAGVILCPPAKPSTFQADNPKTKAA